MDAGLEEFDVLFNRRGLWNPDDRPATWADPEASFEQDAFWTVFDICMNNLPEHIARVYTMRELLERERLSDQIDARAGPQCYQAAGGSAAGSILGGVLKVLPGIIGGGGDSAVRRADAPRAVAGVLKAISHYARQSRKLTGSRGVSSRGGGGAPPGRGGGPGHPGGCRPDSHRCAVSRRGQIAWPPVVHREPGRAQRQSS